MCSFCSPSIDGVSSFEWGCSSIVGCDAQRDCLGPLASSELSCFAWPVW